MLKVLENEVFPILGREDRAEKLIDWSGKQETTGLKYSVVHPTGLTIHFISNGLEPKIYFHWNPSKFETYKKLNLVLDSLVVSVFGVEIAFRNGFVKVSIPGVGEGKTLWDEEEKSFCLQAKNDNVNYLLGMVELKETGPVFLNDIECQEELEFVTALAVVEKKKNTSSPKKRLNEVLPARKDLTTKQSYFIKSALIDQILAKKDSGTL